MLANITRLVPRRLTRLPANTFQNYPYFRNSYSPPLRMPDYFLIYGDIHKKSENIETEKLWDDQLEETDIQFEYMSDDQQSEYIEMLQKLETEARVEGIETRASNRKVARAKKKRSKRRHGRDISLRLK